MKKAILAILVVIVVLIAGLCVVIATRPAEFVITRSATVNAPAAAVYNQINDFHKWEAWSPWAKIDPQMRVTYAGPRSGPGASYAWAGNSDVGEGRMTIIEAKQPELVKIDLEFIEPVASTSVTEFSLKPSGNATTVTWTMTTQNNFLGKAFSLVVDMDKMLGSDFEKGLAQLRTVVETPSALASN